MDQKALLLIILIATAVSTCGVMRSTRSTNVPITVDSSPDNIIIKKNKAPVTLEINIMEVDTIKENPGVQ